MSTYETTPHTKGLNFVMYYICCTGVHIPKTLNSQRCSGSFICESNPSIVLQSSTVAIAEVLNYKTALSSYIPSIAKMKSGVRILVAQFRTVCSIRSCSSVESTRSPSVNNTMAVRVKVGNVVVECIEWSQD